MEKSQRIRALRREKDISGTEVAEKLGISAQYYYDIEKGKKRLSAETVSRLAEIFDVTADYILGISDIRKTGMLSSGVDESLQQVHIVTPMEHREYNQVMGRVDRLEKPAAEYPDFATSRDKKDLKKFLLQNEIMFDGVPITDEEKARLQGYMEAMFWDAKQKNKRKKTEE